MSSSGEAAQVGPDVPVIRRRGETLLLGVRAVPSAARTEIRGVYGERLKVAVSAAPEGGKANARLVEAFAGWLDLRGDQVRVESGHGGRDKVVAFSGIMEDELREKLSRLLHGTDATRRTTDGC